MGVRKRGASRYFSAWARMNSSASGVMPAICGAGASAGFSGAGVLMYPGFLDYAAGRLKDRFYILPSSIHELLFIEDKDDVRPEFLKEMVHSINETHVAPEDRLSDCVYHYTGSSGLLEAV